MQVNPARIVLAISIWFLVMVAIAGYYFWNWLHRPIDVNQEHAVFLIGKGASLYSVARELKEQDMIRWPRLWVYYARIADMADIKAGEYRLAEKESPISLLARFQSGDVIKYQITLVEGLTFRDFLNTMHNHQRLENELAGMTDAQILDVLDLGIEHPEGWFFPDTYQFTRGDSDITLLRQAHAQMRTVLENEWERRAEDLPYETPYEALVMASIVEKETGVPYERREIAGVFVRRLQKRMRLQTDPTVIYGMGETYDGNLRRKDLGTANPYNTYVIKGLPPTPIAMPGREAISAALHPADGNALYFVARGDGTHYFSETLEEHLGAVRRYQKKRRADYRSSPAPSEALETNTPDNVEAAGQ